MQKVSEDQKEYQYQIGLSILMGFCYQGRTTYLLERRVTGDKEVSHLSIDECPLN